MIKGSINAPSIIAVMFELYDAGEDGLAQFEISHILDYKAAMTRYSVKVGTDHGYIELTGTSKKSKNGKDSLIYRLTEAGMKFAEAQSRPEPPPEGEPPLDIRHIFVSRTNQYGALTPHHPSYTDDHRRYAPIGLR